MIASRFRSLGWVAGVATAALGCYMVSLRVASERGQLETVESRILAAKADIRRLQTELQTRGRLVQLERWNKDVLALQAPRAEQYLEGEMQLASLVRPALPEAVADATRDPGTTPVGGKLVRAGYPQPGPDSGAREDALPAIRPANYVRPRESRLDAGSAAGVRQVALLDDAVLGEIGRAAAAEKSGKNFRP